MLSQCIVVFICLAVSFGEEYQSYYVPEYSPQIGGEIYNDAAGYGRLGIHEHDDGGKRYLENVHDIHGAKGYDQGERQALRDVGQRGYINQGARAGLHSSGAQAKNLRQAHDRGFHEKEKKYGYEKGFGYERETSHRDAADNAASQGNKYRHDENRAHYNQGGNALRDLALDGSRYNRGSEVLNNRNALVDLRGVRSRGRDVNSQYDNRYKLRDVKVVPRREQLRPVVIQRYIPEYDDSMKGYQYMNGIYGLGGLRSYGQGYGYNPVSYGYGSVVNTLPGNGLSYYGS